MTSDAQLLQDFARDRSQAAFAELVRRHLDLVYSAALRQVGGDAHLAGDVAQKVFLDLAAKAAAIPASASLAGWLYKAAHYTAANTVRAERRRKKYEQEAQAMHTLDHDPAGDAEWARLRPLLDETMFALDEPDREAVLRRFFSAQSFGQIGAALNLSEDGARRRVERALDKLHGLLARRGITSGAGALALVLSRHAVHAAPLKLHAAVVGGALGGTATLSFFTGLSLFFMNKLVIGAAAALTVVLATLAVRENSTQAELNVEVARLRGSEMALARTREALRREVAALTAEQQGASVMEEVEDVRDTQARWKSLDMYYAGFFRRSHLPRDKIDALKPLLIRRQRVTDLGLYRWMTKAGVPENDLDGREAFELNLILAREVDEEIRGLLGKVGFEYFLEYERTVAARQVFVKRLSQLLEFSPEPLRDEQAEQLVALIDPAIDFANVPLVLPQGTVAHASPILSPLQLEKLRSVQIHSEAFNRIFVLNREAAAAEWITLTEDSQREWDIYQAQMKARMK